MGRTLRDRVPYWIALLAVPVAFLILPSAQAVETDQFMVWDVELVDGAEPINQFFNDEIRGILEGRNRAVEQTCHCPALADDIFRHFFSRRRTSRLKVFMRESDAVEAYPDRSVSTRRYRKMSIYRDITFPWIMPLSRTYRLGDVYFGIDKLGHMFGYGARYYGRYRRHVDYGMNEDDAIERVVRWGILHELTIVGGLTDGVFSHADLEANYQGFRLARNLCEGDAPYLSFDGVTWTLTRAIDLRDYVTPGFDESYNLSHWLFDRRREVLPILREEYAPMLNSPFVQARFDLYRQRGPSRSEEVIHAYFEEKKGVRPRLEQSMTAFDAPPPTALDAFYAGGK